MVEPSWSTVVERGRAILSVPPLTRSEKSIKGTSDPKWALGDLLVEVTDHLLPRLARQLGHSEGDLRRLKEVASKWPPDRRSAASWSSHRELKDSPNRFELISPGMTVRQAASAAGKKPIDSIPDERLSDTQRADRVIALLSNKVVNELVITQMNERVSVRRMKRAARMVQDERSNEYKEALRQMRQAQATKSPELASIEVIFKIQEATEYLRAVRVAALPSDGQPPLMPETRKPDLLLAVEALTQVAQDTLRTLTSGPSGIDLEGVIDVEEARPRPELLE